VVLWGGSNDIAKNNSSVGMKYLLELVMNATHTNVVLMSALHRYDLMETSCVNHEIENFNRKLRKRVERLGQVEMIDVGNDRTLYMRHGQVEMIDVGNDKTLYTRHGQHLNSVGKESMANKLASTILCVLNKKVKPIRGKWYMDNETPGSPTSTANELVLERSEVPQIILDHHPVHNEIVLNLEEESDKHNCSPDVLSTAGTDCQKYQHHATQEKTRSENTTVGAKLNINIVEEIISSTESIRSSSRTKKIPTTRSHDFLWEM